MVERESKIGKTRCSDMISLKSVLINILNKLHTNHISFWFLYSVEEINLCILNEILIIFNISED